MLGDIVFYLQSTIFSFYLQSTLFRDNKSHHQWPLCGHREERLVLMICETYCDQFLFGLTRPVYWLQTIPFFQFKPNSNQGFKLWFFASNFPWNILCQFIFGTNCAVLVGVIFKNLLDVMVQGVSQFYDFSLSRNTLFVRSKKIQTKRSYLLGTLHNNFIEQYVLIPRSLSSGWHCCFSDPLPNLLGRLMVILCIALLWPPPVRTHCYFALILFMALFSPITHCAYSRF